MKAAVLPGMFDAPTTAQTNAERMADTSMAAWAHVQKTLTNREIEVFLALCDYVEQSGYQDASGAELAKWKGTDKTVYRPRLTGLKDKGWVLEGPARASRAGELTVHGYRPALPRTAILRLRTASVSA